METTYYDYLAEEYTCRETIDTVNDKFLDLYGKFYGKPEHKRNTDPLRTKLDTDAITRGEKITKEKYESL